MATTTARSLALLVVALAASCRDATFTAIELEALAQMELPDAPPRSATNRFADDDEAAHLGWLLYFDPRLSGPIAVGVEDVAHALAPAGTAQQVSCNDCHDLAQGGADVRAPLGTSLGAGYTGRSSPGIYYSVDTGPFFSWDGNRDSVWSQVLFPIESGAAHNSSRLWTALVVASHYRTTFAEAFPDVNLPTADEVSAWLGLVGAHPCAPSTGADVPVERCGRPGDCWWDELSPDDRARVNTVFAHVGKALEAYLRTLRPAQAPLDRFLAGDERALDAPDLGAMDPVEGAKLFVGRAGCIECHRGPALTDGSYRNLFVPQSSSERGFVPGSDQGRADGLWKMIDQTTGRPSAFTACGPFADDDPATDASESEIACRALEQTLGMCHGPSCTGCVTDEDCASLGDRPSCHRKRGAESAAYGVCVAPTHDVGAFKVPTLRNVALTAPYMHTGAFPTLWDVVEFYNEAAGTDGVPGTRDRAIAPLGLDDEELGHLVAFLEALSDELEVEKPLALPGCRPLGDGCDGFAACCAGSMP